MLTFGALREFSNGYLFMLDVFMILALLSILLHDTKDRPSLAIALIVYLGGHAVERWWLWNWWGTKDIESSVWSDLMESRGDPALLVSLVLITLGLTGCVFILSNFWGRWAWIVCILLAIVVPTSLMYV